MTTRKVWGGLALLLAVGGGSAQAATVSFTTTQVPTEILFPGSFDIPTRGGTVIQGINDVGQFVGTFGERNATIFGVPHGMIYDPRPNAPLSLGYGTYDRTTTSIGPARLGVLAADAYIDPKYHYLDLKPSAASMFNDGVSTPYAINNAGIVVGKLSSDYLDRDPYSAFIYDTRSQNVQILNAPGAVNTAFKDINNAGQIIGNYTDSSGRSFGFLYSGGVYTILADPAAGGADTFVSGINDNGDIVGSWGGAASYGFIYSNGVFRDFRAATNTATYFTDINNAGDVVGVLNPSGKRTSFLLRGGEFTTLDLSSSGSASTYANSINNAGVIAGSIEDAPGFGFFATVSSVPEPSAWLTLLSGAALLGLVLTRRARESALAPVPAIAPCWP